MPKKQGASATERAMRAIAEAPTDADHRRSGEALRIGPHYRTGADFADRYFKPHGWVKVSTEDWYGDLKPGQVTWEVQADSVDALAELVRMRASWARSGEQAEVPITGNHDRRGLFGAMAIGTGTLCLNRAAPWIQDGFQRPPVAPALGVARLADRPVPGPGLATHGEAVAGPGPPSGRWSCGSRRRRARS